MMAYFTHRTNRFAVKSAVGCFLFGTLLLLVLLAFPEDWVIRLGIAFVLFAAGTNMLLLIISFVNFLVHLRDYQEHVLTLLLTVLNYPIAGLYIYFLSETVL